MNSRKTFIIVLGFFNIFTALGIGRFLFSLVVPYLHSVYLFSFTRIGTIGGAIILGYLIFSRLGGLAAHKYGEKKVNIISLIFLAGSFFSFYFEKNFTTLSVSAFIMGSASASLYMSLFQMVHSRFHKNELGNKVGLILAGAGCGIAILSTIALYISRTNIKIDIFSIWLISAFIALLLIPANALIKSTEKQAGLPHRNQPLKEEIHYLQIRRKIFSDGELRNLTLAYGFFGFSYAAYINYLVAFSAESGGETVSLTVWILFGISSMVSSYIWGKWVDRKGGYRILYFNYLFISIAILLPILFSSRGNIYLSALLFGLCFFGYITVFSRIIVLKTKTLSSVFMGRITLIHAAGQVAGVFLGGYIRDTFGSFRPVFFTSLLVLGLSVFFFSRYGLLNEQ